LLNSVEVCAGAGGQALGLEWAGFKHLVCLDSDLPSVKTIELNRPRWNPKLGDLREWSFETSEQVDLLAGGVPCPPFSHAGKQLGSNDERDLFPEMVRLTGELKPRAVMIENVRGLLDRRFEEYRLKILQEFGNLGYRGEWRLVDASQFGVPQKRLRSVLIALPEKAWKNFKFPGPTVEIPISVGRALLALMKSDGWEGAEIWAANSRDPGPTLVGGSKKHGGADLGPTRARNEWLVKHNVDGRGIANTPPTKDFNGSPRLTLEMAAIIQGFPTDWNFYGKKTPAYRQIGNAFPPPVAEALGRAIATALTAESTVI